MVDREKVIKGLRCLSDAYDTKNCVNCEYDFASCVLDVSYDALQLLKEQEPVEPKRTVDEHGQVLSCGNCGAWFVVQSQKYCHECGRAVKWDDCE